MASDHVEDDATLASALSSLLSTLNIVDLGASEAVDAPPPIYSKLANLPFTRLFSFEPHPGERNRLDGGVTGRTVLADAVGDGNTHLFRSTTVPMTSSLLEPNIEYLARFENLAELCQVESRTPIKTRRLDDLNLPASIDFLKIDVQGATLMVLAGGARTIGATLVVHTEVEFAPIYQGGALFAEVDTTLRNAGFAFHHFHALEGRRVLAGPYAFGPRATRTLWGDAVYVPDFSKLAALAGRELLALAAVAHDCYDARDLSALCFNRYDSLSGDRMADWYRTEFAAK